MKLFAFISNINLSLRNNRNIVTILPLPFIPNNSRILNNQCNHIKLGGLFMKKLLVLFSLVLSVGLVGCSSKSEVKDVPVNDIMNAINNETLLPTQPVAEAPATESYIFESVKDSIKEGFVLQAMMNVKLQDVFVVKTDDIEKVKSAIETYKENNLRMFADGYGGEDNITAATESILESKGNYVYFIATTNAKEIESKILEIIE